MGYDTTLKLHYERTHGTNIKQEQPDLDLKFLKTEEDYELYPTDPLALCTTTQIEGSGLKTQTEGSGLKTQIEGSSLETQIEGSSLKAQIIGSSLKTQIEGLIQTEGSRAQ